MLVQSHLKRREAGRPYILPHNQRLEKDKSGTRRQMSDSFPMVTSSSTAESHSSGGQSQRRDRVLHERVRETLHAGTRGEQESTAI